jgi:hypothetical protein
MYEILWVRPLEFTFGTTATAAVLVLAAFFSGLGLAGGLVGQRADRPRHLIVLYATIELLIALSAVSVYVALQNLGPVYGFLYQSVFHESTTLVTAAQHVLSLVLLARLEALVPKIP